MAGSNDDKYTDPELRQEIKEDIQAGDKGGKPGQWSARKAQMMASEYKKAAHERGISPYTTDKSEQTESQKNLSQWGDEEWQTSDGKANAREEHTNEKEEKEETTKRYLPKKAWEGISEEEKRETDERKVEGSKEGKQFVSNTNAAKEARKNASEHGSGETESEHKDEGGDEVVDGAGASDDDSDSGSKSLFGEDSKADSSQENEGENSNPPAKKRKNNDGDAHATKKADDEEGERNQNKPHKSNDSSKATNDDVSESGTKKNTGSESSEHGQPGSASRLPNEGQTVHWKSSTWVEGTVVEILKSEKKVNGRMAKASGQDPRLVLKSAKSGKEAVHKPSAVYF